MLDLPDIETSLWKEKYTASLYPELDEEIEADAVVVGGGITGLTTAYLLKQAGMKVVVLEKRTVGAGTTGRTTGKVSSQHNLVYADLFDRLGGHTAHIYGQANEAAINKIDEIIAKEDINCGWERDSHTVYTADPSKVSQFKQEAKIAQSLGLPASFETNLPLPFKVQAGVRFTNQAKLHSLQYLRGLAETIDGDGSYIFENSNVKRIKDGAPGIVSTKNGSVRAGHIVVATNVPTMPLAARGGYCVLEYPTESYIVAGKPMYKLHGMYISPDKDHYSLLPVKIANKELLLIGGESNISGVRISKQKKFATLAAYGAKNFGINNIGYSWSDRDYMSYDGMPIVGKLYPWSKNCYVATAFMKWGLTNGTVAAMILRDILCGNNNEWAPTFDSNRLKPIASIPRVAAKYLIPGI